MILDDICVNDESGIVEIRFSKTRQDEGGADIFDGYHRDTVMPGNDEKLIALLGDAEAQRIRDAFWTPEKIQAHGQDSF